MGSTPQHRLGVTQATGTVRHLYPERGFGFIRCTDGDAAHIDQDVFFHASGLERGLTMADLLPGTRVTFEVWDVPRGKRAEHVQLVTSGERTHAATARATRP